MLFRKKIEPRCSYCVAALMKNFLIFPCRRW